jgi:hypothetical protein
MFILILILSDYGYVGNDYHCLVDDHDRDLRLDHDLHHRYYLYDQLFDNLVQNVLFHHSYNLFVFGVVYYQKLKKERNSIIKRNFYIPMNVHHFDLLHEIHHHDDLYPHHHHIFHDHRSHHHHHHFYLCIHHRLHVCHHIYLVVYLYFLYNNNKITQNLF